MFACDEYDEREYLDTYTAEDFEADMEREYGPAWREIIAGCAPASEEARA